ncbi:uncharacterized protein EMH_0091610 [Eimeria mitis]|uniref:Uncharacterized protein n=1 Tax=Eimeria mitis TaxID=44415 RepID=U6K9D2_9EIME|nr:uncharacterized protein EMH_0091610 [Eimeria mitis]CDJ34640.1 hypothetical protein EMH_0091610 [Eimeria mitis]
MHSEVNPSALHEAGSFGVAICVCQTDSDLTADLSELVVQYVCRAIVGNSHAVRYSDEVMVVNATLLLPESGTYQHSVQDT